MPNLNVKYSKVPIEPEPAVANMTQVPDERSDLPTNPGAAPDDNGWREDIRRGRLNGELLTAVQHREIRAIKGLLDEGASANASCRPSGTTVLHLATVHDDSDTVQLLLERGPDVMRRDRAGRQAVHFAAARGFDDILGMLLEADPTLVDSRISTDTADPRDANNYDSWSHDHDDIISMLPELSGGSTPLHLATQRGHYKCVDLLLSYNADVNITDDRGLTPLDVTGEIKSVLQLFSFDDFPGYNEYSRPYDKTRDWLAKSGLSDTSPGGDTAAEEASHPPPAPRSMASDRIPSDVSERGSRRRERRDPTRPTPRFTVAVVTTHGWHSRRNKTISSPAPIVGGANYNAQGFNLPPGARNEQQEYRSRRRTRFGGDTSSDESSDSPPPYGQSGFTTSEEHGVPSSEPPPTNSIHRIVNSLINKGAKIPRSKLDQKGGSVSKQLQMPVTCLHTAVDSGDTQLIQFLLKNGACPMTWNKAGKAAIHLAVVKHLVEPLRVLLEWDKCGPAVDARDSKGRTPLHLAVTKQWAAGISILLEAGADVKATSNDNQTVLHLAVKNGNCQLLRGLLSIPDSAKIMDWGNKSYETPLYYAVSEGYTSCANLLLEHGADSTTRLPGDVTLLHIAAQTGNAEILKILLRDTKAIDTLKDVRSTQDKGGMTPLHVACWNGYLDCTQILINAGSRLDAKTTVSPHFGATPLHLAARGGHLKVVKHILGCDKDTLIEKNSDKWYPLHVAATYGHKDCVREMLKHGANLAATIVDSGGYTKTAFDIIAFSVADPECFFEEIFDHFIQPNEYPLNNPGCLINVKYDLLKPLGEKRKQLKVLDALLNCTKQRLQEKLLQHPLVETFLYLKWMRLRVFFFFIIALYFTFTMSLTTMALFTYVCKGEDAVTASTVAGCRIVTIVTLVVIVIKELLHASRLQRYYITDLESWVKWSAFLTGAVVVVCDHNVNWLIHVTSVAVLLAWLELLFLLSRCPSAVGYYILMFFTVANKVVKVLATFTFVILGFTFAFLIFFQGQAPFHSPWEALVKVIVMTSEFDYTQMFEPFPGVTPASVVGRSIFLGYVILVSIVLMNLLIGLAVSDIATLEVQGRKQRLAKQIDFLSMMELFVYNKRFYYFLPEKICSAIKKQRVVVSHIEIQPDKPSQVCQMLPHELRRSVIVHVANQKKSKDKFSLTELTGKIDQVANMAEKALNGQNVDKMLPTSNPELNEPVVTEKDTTNAVLERILAENKKILGILEIIKQKGT